MMSIFRGYGRCINKYLALLFILLSSALIFSVLSRYKLLEFGNHHAVQHNIITLKELTLNERSKERKEEKGSAEVTEQHEESLLPSMPRIQVVYKDLSKCPPRPQYFPELKGHCWGTCIKGQKCNQPPNYEDVQQQRANISCFANMQLIGVRKSGTTDFSKWKRERGDLVMKTLDYQLRSIDICPVEYFGRHNFTFSDMAGLRNGIYLDGPGNLGMNQKVSRNRTHLIIMTSLQYIGYMVVPETKLYLQIRNPTDRAISYLFFFHNARKKFPNITHEEMDAKMVDSIIQDYLHKLKNCIAKYGELYCVYWSDGRSVKMEGLLAHSMYVVYLEEAFKFIPRENLMIRTYEEYSKRTDDLVKELDHDYFKIPFKEIPAKWMEKIKQGGNKNPVWNSTLQLLDEFYEPYNRRLADLLGDDKWLFPVQRTQ